MKEIASHMLEVDNGALRHYHGGLDYYLEKKAGTDSQLKQKAFAAAAQEALAKKDKHKQSNSFSTPPVRDAHAKHNEALKRLEDIKKETKSLEKEKGELETESYVKSRFLTDTFGRDQSMIKEYGIRLKDIQKRMREITVTLEKLQQEKIDISK